MTTQALPFVVSNPAQGKKVANDLVGALKFPLSYSIFSHTSNWLVTLRLNRVRVHCWYGPREGGNVKGGDLHSTSHSFRRLTH